MKPVGVIANPMSGRDVRRLAARARRETPEDKRNQLERIFVGAAAAGAKKILLMPDCFRISAGAAELLNLGIEFEFVDIGELRTRPEDTLIAAQAMRDAGCESLVVLGGDGTNRVITQVWPDAPLIPLSTGTNNVFPEMIEATVAGAAAGLVASGVVPRAEVAQPVKIVKLRFEDGADEIALIDAVKLENESLGNLMPFETGKLREVVLARAEPAAVGMSPIGGLLHPSSRYDEFGVFVRCTSHEEGGRPLLVPVSPGLYRNAHIGDSRELPLGEEIEITGPGVIAVDGDRIRELAAGERAWARVVREGPHVIDVALTLRKAAESGSYLDKAHWHDKGDLLAGDGGMGCC